jgi:hypothetical protein
MTTTAAAVLGTEARRYLGAVASRSRHLGSVERAELLEDVAGHLGEITAETASDLEAQLGSPDAFADDFLASAGLAVSPASSVDRWVTFTLAHVRTAISGACRTASDTVVAMRPAWWAARGGAIVAALAGRYIEFFYDHNGVWLDTAGVIAVAILLAPISLRLGIEATAGRRRGWNAILDLAAIVAIVVAAGSFERAR